ncbi:MAG: hypothetical protein M3Y87_19530 [Myxococcota bacterium]|nr:hypothetical protein [Myxococcota bacterium]
MSAATRTPLLALLAAVLAMPTSSAHAHGREPALGHIAFHPTDRDLVVVRATWGFITTRDGGDTWTWQCADAVPFDRTREDPGLALFASGALVTATFDGLHRSDEARCAWSPAEGAPTDAFVTDVIRDPTAPSIGWAISSPGMTPDVVHRSDDEGRTWTAVSMPHEAALTDRIRIAPSDGTRIYTSGVVPRSIDMELRLGMVLRSDDRGATFRALPVELIGEERTVHLLGVDPTDADRVFARAVRRVTDEVPERLLLSEDGGETWTTVLELLEIVGFAISEDGRTVWAGSWDGGLHRSTDGGLTFTPLDPSLRIRCLAHRAGELWVCADDFVSGFALARSSDGGDTLEPLWSFHDVVPDVGCPASTEVGTLCPMYWPDLVYDLQLDGAVPPDGSLLDGGVAVDAGGDAGGGGCGCAVIGSSRPETPRRGLLGLVMLVALGAALARRSNDRGRRRHGRI